MYVQFFVGLQNNLTFYHRFFKRQLRIRLDLLKPDYGDQALGKQADQKNYHDLHSRDRQFGVGQKVMARNFLQGLTWVPGVVTEVCGPSPVS